MSSAAASTPTSTAYSSQSALFASPMDLTLHLAPFAILFLYTENEELKAKYKEFEAAQVFNSMEYNSGFDLYTPKNYTWADIATKRRVDLEVKCKMVTVMPRENNTTSSGEADKYYGYMSGYYLYPRSSMSKSPLRLANSVGIIDSGYRGNIMAAVDVCLPPAAPVNAICVQKMERLVQLCAPDLRRIFLVVVDSLEELNGGVATERGSRGFGGECCAGKSSV